METYWISFDLDHFTFYLIDIDEKGLYYDDETYRIKTAFYPRKSIQREINGYLCLIQGAFYKEGRRYKTIDEVIQSIDAYPRVARYIFLKNVFGGQ